MKKLKRRKDRTPSKEGGTVLHFADLCHPAALSAPGDATPYGSPQVHAQRIYKLAVSKSAHGAENSARAIGFGRKKARIPLACPVPFKRV